MLTLRGFNQTVRMLLPMVLSATCPWLAVSAACAETIVDGPAIADEKQGANWLSVGRTYTESRYSPLKAVNDENVRQLGLAWFLDLQNQSSLQGTPLAVDGVLYFSGSNGRVYAVDGLSGRELWEFDPDLAHHAVDTEGVLYGQNRGVAYWRGRVYVGTSDGRLIALTKEGKVLWSVNTFDTPNPRKTISGAPRAFNNKVIIGHSGELGPVAGVRGYVTAYDATTGRQMWRFYTVPGDPAKGFESPAMAMAAKTWRGEWWKGGGNGSVWDNITYDPEFNRVYIGTGNGSPANADIRSPGGGNNLFVASIVALNADTGEYVWHYQITPRDSFEYDATQNMVLADLTFGGKPRKVLMQASKNGFFYVIERATGKLLSAEKFAKATWAERIDVESGRPVETPHLRDTKTSIAMWPSVWGAHNWQPMSYNPGTRLVYIPTQQRGILLGPNATIVDYAPQESDENTGGLVAWDPVAQGKRWEVHYPDSFWNSGTLTTAGNLIFQGTGRGQFIAYNATTGEKLCSFYAGLGISAAPMTYALGGVQYVSVLVGYGGATNFINANYGWHFNEQSRRLLTFSLDGHKTLPPTKPPRFTVNAIDDPALVIDAKEAAEGEKIYNRSACTGCHGMSLNNFGSMAPDLRESALAMNWMAFRSVLHEGTLAGLGMPRFAEFNDEHFPKSAQEQEERLKSEADRIYSYAKLAEPYGLSVEIYNHDGWYAVIENELAMIDRLKKQHVTNVGLVYNFYHAHDMLHDDTKDFPRLWERVQLYVAVVGLAGVRGELENLRPSQGDHELEMMRTIERSGWRGPVGILAAYADEDPESGLRNILLGTEWLAAELKSAGSAGPRPAPQSGAQAPHWP